MLSLFFRVSAMLYKLFIGSVFLYLLFACSGAEKTSDKLLCRLENLAETHPDSVLQWWQVSLPAFQELSKEQQACYALVILKAREKCSKLSLADSALIAALRDLKEEDCSEAGKAFFYTGLYDLKRRHFDQAEENFLKAREVAEKTEDYTLLVRLNRELSRIYFFRRQWTEAKQMNEEALRYAVLAKDSMSIPTILRNSGRLFLVCNEIDSALICYNRALAKAEKLHLLREQSSILYELSNLYKKSKDFNQAEDYALQAIRLTDEDRLPRNLYQDVGYIFWQNGQLDSARYYLKKSIEEGEIREKTKSYALLYELEKKAGRWEDAFQYSDYCLKFQDSLNNRFHKEVMIRLKERRIHEKLEKENIRLLISDKENRLWFYRILCFMLILGIVTTYLWIRNHFSRRRWYHFQKEIEKTRKTEKQEYENEIFRLRNELVLLQNLSVKDTVLSKLKTENSSGSIRLSDQDWVIIYEFVNKLSDRFTEKLSIAYPFLNQEDIRFCCLLKLKVKTTLIAEIFCISTDAVLKRKYRLKKEKLGLSADRTLDDFLYAF